MNVGHPLPTRQCYTHPSVLSAFAFQSQYIFLHSCILDKILEEPLLGLSRTER